MFTLFEYRPQLPASFERWSEVDIVTDSEMLYRGPPILEVRSLKRWLDEYERCRAGYDEFIKAAQRGCGGGFTDDFDRRLFEHYAAMLLQSGQWRAILLMLLEDPSDAERSRYLSELDGLLAYLREQMVRR